MVSDGSVVLISATAEAISSGNDSTAACHSGAANEVMARETAETPADAINNSA